MNTYKRCGDAFSRYCALGSHPKCWADNNDCTNYVPSLGSCLNTCSSNTDCPTGLTCGNYPVNVVPLSDYIKPNRDYYSDLEWQLDASAGVGQGTLASRPTTCTPGVAYWATDQNKLYQCTAPNTWNLYYTPYTHPYPLQGVVDAIPPAGPSGLAVN